MSQNVMNEYIKLARKHINDYIKVIFNNKFSRTICNEYIDSYMEIRYFDLNENKSNRILKNDILELIEEKKEILIAQYEEEKQKEEIEIMANFFTFIVYLDNVIPYKDIDKVVKDIEEARKKYLGYTDDEFIDNIYNVIIKNEEEKSDLFQKYESKEFYLKLTNYKNISNVQRVNLKYNFELPKLYNSFAIEKAFTIGTTNEDKLFVEYYLITTHIINDIIKGNFKKQYIVEFAKTLFEKNQKIERLLNIINNPAIQDKLSLKIKYECFLENKENVYELLKRGFRIAVIIDDTFETTYEEIEKLEIFSYILVNKDTERYNKIIKNRRIIDKIIQL